MLDSRLRFLTAKGEEGRAELNALEDTGRFALRSSGRSAPKVTVLAQVDPQVTDEELAGAGLVVRTRAGDVVSGEIPLRSVSELDAIEGVVLVEASRPMHQELDRSMPETRANIVHTGPPGRRGAGVIVGVIDSGVDWRHDSFRGPTGGSRIVRIWDQNLAAQAGESAPAAFGYGVEYTQTAINAALTAPDPLDVVRHMDDSVGHGTHVCGIAAGDGSVAGDGSPAFTFIGMAPEADLAVVANRVTTTALGDSASTLDAVRYLFDVGTALGRPVVINLSQGDNLGPHDGTSLLERGIDNLLGTSGRSMVKSAGNAAAAGVHASGVLAAGTTATVQFSCPANDTSTDTLDFWYAGTDAITFRITPPGGSASAVVNPGETTTLNMPNGNQVFVDSVQNHPNNGDNRIYVELQPGTQAQIASGTWTIALGAVTIFNGRWDGWIERGNTVPQFLGVVRNDAITISVPGTAREVITAASYITKGAGVGSLSSFSSRGPTRDGRTSPTIAAPGQAIMSALVGASGTGQYQSMSGTSMAAPHVTGAIALMLQAAPTLTQSDIIACLTSNARTDVQTGTVPNNDWGAGKMDAAAAVACGAPAVITPFTQLTRFTPFTSFTPLTSFTRLTRFTPFTSFTRLTLFTPFTRFTRFTPFTLPPLTRPPGPIGPIDPRGPDSSSDRPPVRPFIRFGGTILDPAELGLERAPELGGYLEPLAQLGIERLDQLASIEPEQLAEALGIVLEEGADLVAYAQTLLRSVVQP